MWNSDSHGVNLNVYGNYWHESFSQVYNKAEDFIADYNNVGIPTTISTDLVRTLYYLLYARYGNDIVASSDLNQFKYKLFSTIFMYGPSWAKRLDIQSKIRELGEDELTLGSTQINNQALNQGTNNTNTKITEELDGVNSQFVTKYRKDKMSAYSMQWQLIETDVTKQFLDKFNNLFRFILEPDERLIYKGED